MVVADRRAAGFTLVGLVIIFTVMTILVAAAMPMWSKVIQRDREEELIFRGLQYAEAIRVFQMRTGRFPIKLEELMTIRPRCLRRLWSDPMTESGEWGLIYAQAATGPRGRPRAQRQTGRVAPMQQAEPQVFGGSGPRSLGGDEGRQAGRRQPGLATAPIIGVHSLSDGEAAKDFFGGGRHSDWRFTVEILPSAVLTPDNLNLARANSRWVGRPFPADLSPAQGGAPVAQGEAPKAESSRRRRSQRDG